MGTFQAITFDFWNTLYTETEEMMRRRMAVRAERVCQVTAAFGRPVSSEEALAAVEAAAAAHGEMWRERRRTMTSEQVGRKVAAALGRRTPLRLCLQIGEAVSSGVVEVPPNVDPQAPGVLAALAESYRLGVISDTGLGMGASLRRVLERDGILRHFRSQTFSDEVGAAKPSAEAFADACEKLAVHPAAAVHVGDMESTDMAGAKAYGMYAIRIDRNGTADGSAADLVIRELAELPDAVAELERQLP